jgi:transposase
LNRHCQRRDFRGRRVMAKPITYIGLDVHKETIAVALAVAGLRGEVREHGKIPNTPAALKALAVKLAPAGAGGS